MKPKYRFKGRSVSDEGVEIYLWDVDTPQGPDQGWASVDWFWRDPHVEYTPPPIATEPVPVADVLVELYALADPCTPNAECGHDKCKALEEIRQNLHGLDYALARVREWIEPVVNWVTSDMQHRRSSDERRTDIANYCRAALEPSTGIYRPSVLDYPLPPGMEVNPTPEPTHPVAYEEPIGPDGKTVWLRTKHIELNGETP